MHMNRRQALALIFAGAPLFFTTGCAINDGLQSRDPKVRMNALNKDSTIGLKGDVFYNYIKSLTPKKNPQELNLIDTAVMQRQRRIREMFGKLSASQRFELILNKRWSIARAAFQASKLKEFSHDQLRSIFRDNPIVLSRGFETDGEMIEVFGKFSNADYKDLMSSRNQKIRALAFAKATFSSQDSIDKELVENYISAEHISIVPFLSDSRFETFYNDNELADIFKMSRLEAVRTKFLMTMPKYDRESSSDIEVIKDTLSDKLMSRSAPEDVQAVLKGMKTDWGDLFSIDQIKEIMQNANKGFFRKLQQSLKSMNIDADRVNEIMPNSSGNSQGNKPKQGRGR